MNIKTGLLLMFLFVIAQILFNRCVPRYGLANAGGEPIYFSKPLYKDSLIVSNFIGGKFCHSIDSAYYHTGETNYFGEIYLFQTYTKSNFDLSYGFFGYAGNYKVVKIEEFKGIKSYYGGGLSGEFNFTIPLEKVELRLFGFRGSILYENGLYSDFRKQAAQRQLIENCDLNNYAFNLSYSNEIIISTQMGNFGLYASTGFTRNFHNEVLDFTMTSCFNYTINQYSAYFQYTNCTLGMGNIYSIGLNYRIK